MKLLGELAKGQQPVLQVQDPAAFRYFRLPDESAFAELRKRGIAPVSYEIYSELIKQFIPADIYARVQHLLDSKKIEHSTNSIHSKIRLMY